MEASSRRNFLRQAGIGAAALGAAVTLPQALGRDRSASATPNAAAEAAPATPVTLEGPLVAYLRDARTGEFSLLVGTREVRYTDRRLAAQLTHAAR